MQRENRQASDAAMQKEVEGAVKGFLKGNERALINYSVDARIIGGMVISVGDKFCDMIMSIVSTLSINLWCKIKPVFDMI